MAKRPGPPNPASFGFKLRQFSRSLPTFYTHEDLSKLAKIQRPTLTKWANEGDPANQPQHDWVLRMVRAVGAPDVLADWLRNGKPIPMPVSPGATPVGSVPDPLRDVITGRFESVECMPWVANSEWSGKEKQRGPRPTIEIPASLVRDGAIALPLDGMDVSMRDLAEQGHMLIAYPIDRTPKVGDLVVARKKDRLIARVLRSGDKGYELHLANRSMSEVLPATGWSIDYLPVAVLRHAEPGRLNIDLRPSGFTV